MSTPPNKSALRFRRNPFDVESAIDPSFSPLGGSDMYSQQARIDELEEKNKDLVLQRQTGQSDNLDIDGEDKYKRHSGKDTVYRAVYDRGSWLVGLLIVQSCSSFILAEYETLLGQHPTIVYFLTMLIGAGGNAGNQAAVKMIREIALGNSVPKRRNALLQKELVIALALTGLVGLAGLLRSILLSQATIWESTAITICLVIIVFASIALGAVLPFALLLLGVDPAHSSTSIQVIMDILGVLLVCSVSSLMLH